MLFENVIFVYQVLYTFTSIPTYTLCAVYEYDPPTSYENSERIQCTHANI